jgi:hypothetical protein
MPGDVRSVLLKRWMHSHEEDTASESIYRPAEYDFPPARGRSGFELRADGSCVYVGISPRDGHAEQPCTWTLEGEREPLLTLNLQSGTQNTLRIASASDDKLVVRK